jgi:uncharacterized protein (DUF58 family)
MAGNRIVYGMIIFMTAAFVFLFEHRTTYAALYAVLLLPMISLTILLIAKRHIYFSEKLEVDTIKKGEAARYILYVKNNNYIFTFRAKAVFRKDLRPFAKISKSDGIYLPPRENGEAVFEMIYNYRGAFTVGADYIYIYDFLCLFKVRIKNPKTLKLTVLPDINNLDALPVSFSNPADAQKADSLIAEDYADFPDLKKYEPVDGYKRIHWQVSAKRGELISKNYNASEKSATAVIINNSRFVANKKHIESLRCADNLIEMAVSVIAYCNAAALPVYLDFIGGTSGTPSLDFDVLYALAAGIEFDKTEDFDGFLTDIIEMRHGAGNIYIFTETASEHVTGRVKQLYSAGRNVMIFYYTKEGMQYDKQTD